MKSIANLFVAVLLGCPLLAQDDAVRVFVLAGQSNMEGKAQNKLLEFQAEAPATKDFFAPYRARGAWIERDDVFIKYLDRHGPLTIGYGSPDRTGCELAFGCEVGDRIDAPVLLIKTCWGGRSLHKDFRPPSAGLPAPEALEQELAQRRERTEKQNREKDRNDPLPTMAELQAEYGRSYREMIAEVRETLARCDELFPALAGRPRELAGFVWFQGWNDQYGGAEAEYEQNLRHLIGDVRRDLGTEGLPIVIGVMGQNGRTPAKGAMLAIQNAQLAVGRTDDLHDVRSVRTDELVDDDAAALYPEWKERLQEWERIGSDHPYHYLGSAIWFCRIGRAFGAAMMDMIE